MHVTDHPLRIVRNQSLQAIIGNCAHKVVLGTSASDPRVVSNQSLQAIIGNCAHKIALGTSAAAPSGQDPQDTAGEPA